MIPLLFEDQPPHSFRQGSPCQGLLLGAQWNLGLTWNYSCVAKRWPYPYFRLSGILFLFLT